MKNNKNKLVLIIVNLLFLILAFNSFAQWQPTNLGNVGTFFKAIATKDNKVYVGNGSGVYVTNDFGDNWTSIGLQNRTINEIVLNKDYIFVSTDSGVYITNNNGASWSLANIPILGTFHLTIYDTLVYVSDGSSHYCYYTLNNGTSWTQSGYIPTSQILCIGVNGNNIFLGRGGSIVTRSIDNGINWTNITVLSASNIINFTFFTNKIYLSTNSGIFVSTNNGTNWTKIFDTVNNTNHTVMNVLVDSNNIFAVTWDGIFMSTNMGSTWTACNDGFPTSQPSAIYTTAITKCGNYLFVPYNGGTFGGPGTNVYRRPICELAANAPAAATAGVISGNTLVCRGQTNLIYTVPIIANAISYQWFLPYGFYGNSNTNSINLVTDNNTVSGNIKVKGSNGCTFGDSSMLAVTVKSVPTTPGLINGNTNVSAGQLNVAYLIPLNSNADFYKWNLPMGANGISTTNSINVNFAGYAQSGLIKVRGHNICGDGNASSMQVVVNNNLNTGATLFNDIGIFPSPASYSATISYTLKVNQHFSISVYDITGREIKEIFNAFQQSGAHHLTIDISDITTGIYFLKALGEENFETVKFRVKH